MSWVYTYRKGKDFELITSRYFILLIVTAFKTSVCVWHGKICAPPAIYSDSFQFSILKVKHTQLIDLYDQ